MQCPSCTQGQRGRDERVLCEFRSMSMCECNGFFNIRTVIGLNNKAVHCLLSLPPNPSSRCGLMSRGQSEKKLREDTQLHKTQLCMRMNNCKHLWKGDCKFAHDLQDLRPTPSSWTKTKGHHWEPGKPLPDLEVVALIEQYATLRDDLLVWVHELRAQVEKERRLPDPVEVASMSDGNP